MKMKFFGFKTIFLTIIILITVAITFLSKERQHKTETIHKEIEIKKK